MHLFDLKCETDRVTADVHYDEHQKHYVIEKDGYESVELTERDLAALDRIQLSELLSSFRGPIISKRRIFS